MAPLSGEWLEALKGEFHQPYYVKLYKTVMQEYQSRKIFPPADDMFNAFHFTPLSQVKVVILGQDPYHNDGQAHGLCFSVKKDVEIPPSLVNIYQELHDDLGCYIPDNGYLEKWARQGVLMLNTVLTVRAHQANSHRGIGWEQFTDCLLYTSHLAVRLWAMKFLRKTNLNQCSAPAKQSFPAKNSDFSVPMDGETENGCMIGKKNAKKTVQFLYPTVSFARKNQMTMQ